MSACTIFRIGSTACSYTDLLSAQNITLASPVCFFQVDLGICKSNTLEPESDWELKTIHFNRFQIKWAPGADRGGYPESNG